jgi:hypothetical protein
VLIAYGPVIGWQADGRDAVLASVSVDACGVVVNVELEDGEHAGFMLRAAAVDPQVYALLVAMSADQSAA